MRSIGGRGGEGAVVGYCFGEEEGAEEEEEGFCSGGDWVSCGSEVFRNM